MYSLPEWSVLLETPEAAANQEDEGAGEVDTVCIKLEDSVKLGCAFKAENSDETLELFNKFNNTSA